MWGYSQQKFPGVLLRVLGGGGGEGGRQPVLQILTLLQTKTCNFPHLFSDQTSKIYTRFQTWPLGRNYALHYLDRKQNNSSNSFRMRIFLFLTYSFGIKTINTCSCKYVHALPKFPSKTIPDSRPYFAKCTTLFRPKRRKKPYLMGRHIPI